MPSARTEKRGDSSDFGEIAPTTRHYPALQIKQNSCCGTGKRRLFRFMGVLPLSGFRVRREIGLIFVAEVTCGCRCGTGRKGAAKSGVSGSNGNQTETARRSSLAAGLSSN